MGWILAVPDRKYVWRIKVTKDKSRSKSIYAGLIGIGVIGMKTDDETCYRSDGKGIVLQENGALFNGRYGQKICPDIKYGDIITIELDLELDYEDWGWRSLGFGLNDDWYGIVTSTRSYMYFRLFVTMIESGITVEIIDFYEEKLDVHA